MEVIQFKPVNSTRVKVLSGKNTTITLDAKTITQTIKYGYDFTVEDDDPILTKTTRKFVDQSETLQKSKINSIYFWHNDDVDNYRVTLDYGNAMHIITGTRELTLEVYDKILAWWLKD